MNKNFKILVILILLSSVVFLVIKNKDADIVIPNNKTKIEVYYKNNTSKTLEYETRFISDKKDSNSIRESLEAFLSAPKSAYLISNYNPNIDINDVKYFEEQRKVEVYFSTKYRDMTTIEEVFFRTASVWTLTSLDYIEDVYFFVGDEPLLTKNGVKFNALGRNNILINPELSPDKSGTKEVILYFSDENKEMLLPVVKYIGVNPDKLIEKYIVEQLIEGPNDTKLRQIVPRETKIREIRTELGICFINLSADFLTKQLGDVNAEKLAVYSIVNSITELEYITSVQFLIDSKRVDMTIDDLDFSVQIERNENIIFNDSEFNLTYEELN
jgi:germination protein M